MFRVLTSVECMIEWGYTRGGNMLSALMTVAVIYAAGVVVAWALWGFSGFFRDESRIYLDDWWEELKMILQWPVVLACLGFVTLLVIVIGPILLYLDARDNTPPRVDKST